MGYYRLIDHTADLGMEIFGADAPALFINAGRALFDVMIDAKERSEFYPEYHTLEVGGADWSDLMVNWLRELLYLWNADQKILLQIKIQTLSEIHLSADVAIEYFDPLKHRIEKEIKAVTYHQIEVGPCEKGWRARVVFDL